MRIEQTDAAWLTDAFKPRGNVDAVAHQIAIALLNDVADVDAEAKLDSAISGTPALRSTIAFCSSTAQRTASTALRNSAMEPSPVRLTMRPLCMATVGSIRSLRSVRRRASVRSSAPTSRLYPTTSETRIAANLRDFSHLCALLLRTSYHGVVGEVA